MNHALSEAKLQAKRYLKHLKKVHQSLLLPKRYKMAQKEIDSEMVQLKHCQVLIAAKLGFESWNQLHALLSFSDGQTMLDFGTLFHKPACDVYLNHWFADYESARQHLNSERDHFLLPFKKQCVVVSQSYINTLNLHAGLTEQWQAINHDLVAGYATDAWDRIASRAIENKLSVLFQ